MALPEAVFPFFRVTIKTRVDVGRKRGGSEWERALGGQLKSPHTGTLPPLKAT